MNTSNANRLQALALSARFSRLNRDGLTFTVVELTDNNGSTVASISDSSPAADEQDLLVGLLNRVTSPASQQAAEPPETLAQPDQPLDRPKPRLGLWGRLKAAWSTLTGAAA